MGNLKREKNFLELKKKKKKLSNLNIHWVNEK